MYDRNSVVTRYAKRRSLSESFSGHVFNSFQIHVKSSLITSELFVIDRLLKTNMFCIKFPHCGVNSTVDA